MEYRQLGRSGLRVSALALGTWVTSGGQLADEQAVACIHAALDAGITTFDTADVYASGRAESLLGRALAGVDRTSVEIATKVGYPVGPGANQRGLSRKRIVEACEASLRRLRTDHLDLYQAHTVDPATPVAETLEAFDQLVSQGKVLYVGVSGWSAAQLADGLAVADELGLRRPVANQPEYSMLCRTVEADMDPLCRKEGLSQLAWSPLAQGLLTGKYRLGRRPPTGSRATDHAGGGERFIRRWMRDDVLDAVARLEPIARQAGLTMSQLALAWVLQNDNVASAIVGASRPEQVVENAAAVGHRLDSDVLTAIDGAIADVVERAGAGVR